MRYSKAPVNLLIFALVKFASCQGQDRIKGWEADLDFYAQQVKQQHYVYREKILPAAFNEQSERLRKQIPAISDQQILLEFERLAATLGDGHTYVLPWGATRVAARGLPFRFYLFSDGLFIIDAPEGFRDFIGSRVIKFGDVTAEDAVSQIGNYISKDNEMGATWIGPVFLSFQGALEAIGACTEKDRINLTLANQKTGKSTQWFSFVPIPPMHGIPKLVPPRTTKIPPPLYLSNVEKAYWVESIKTKQGTQLYLQFNQVIDDPTESLAEFSKRLADSILIIHPKLIVVDVRHNNGGNADLLNPLLAVLSGFRKNNPSAKLVFITGRNTFSACQIFISRADTLVRPIFAGERSSSKPNFVGEENNLMLPYSGAICSISNRYHETIPGDKREWIEVEMPVALSSKSYFANVDPVLDKVLSIDVLK